MRIPFRLPFPSKSLHVALPALLFLGGLFTPEARAQATLVASGQPETVIMTRPGPSNPQLKAAQEMQKHLQLMSGALVTISTVGQEASFPGKKFIYLGPSAAATAAGIATPSTREHYTIRTLNSNLYIVGNDAGSDWTLLSDCQPGTMFGVYHVLGEILGVRWLWPGDDGIVAPQMSTITVPAQNFTTGPIMSQRKFRNPKVGLYKGGAATYGFGIDVLPADNARRIELANEELLWQRRQRMGTRTDPAFAHSFTTWWSSYGVSNPEYFAVLHSGTQPRPEADRVKLNDSSPVVWDKIVANWVANGKPDRLNICPNDSRNFCVCSNCLAWDRPSQAPDIVNTSSSALLGDRYARFYTEVANRVKALKSTTIVYGYAYDVYRNAPLEATVPDNVALAYIPGAPDDTTLAGIAETQSNVLGWIAAGCTKMYLRPNWMLSAHTGPFWPTYRVGNHFRNMLAGGYLLGMDSDSSCSSYSGFGLYYYLIARLMANPSLTVDAIMNEYCSGFGSASVKVRDYFTYWENFIYNQADSGNTTILGWQSCVAAYPGAYTDAAFNGAEQILNEAVALLGPTETAAKARLDFLRLACTHGRLTSRAISLVSPTLPLSSNPQAEQAMRALLTFRNANAESFAIWREWMIDRESNVPNMQNYWSLILANPGGSSASNVGAFYETAGLVVLEAEHFTGSAVGTGISAGISWQENTTTAGAIGTTMEALPNSATANNETLTAPRLDFKVDLRTTGPWKVLVRTPGLAGSDNSVNVGIDGAIIAKNVNSTAGGWRWPGTTGTTSLPHIDVITPGVHTFSVWMREDGVIVDRIVLTTNLSYTLTTADLGPAESLKRGTTEYLLTVNKGSGGGYYGASSYISIIADSPPANKVFDQWTTADGVAFANAFSATTYATVPAAASAVTATYKLDPALDTDSDGMLDSWETASFGNLTTASATSDFDQDGSTDLQESFAGTDPQDPNSTLRVRSITPAGTSGDILVQWSGVVGKTYRILTKPGLQAGSWTPIAIGIPGQAPLTTYQVHLASGREIILVEVEVD